MPGFTTHYLFGVNAYKDLKNTPLKKNICGNHAAYSLGLQGPDLFFYYLPSYALHENNIGSTAHITETGVFLEYLLKSVNLFPDKKEAAIARAYVMGFIGHYLLDCSCHPYIYWRTHYQGPEDSYHGRHMNLEVDIDTELLDFYKKKLPSGFRQRSTILLTRREVRVIATILYYVYSMTYPDLKITYTAMRLAIRSLQVGTKLLYDPHGKKKVLIRKLEAMTLGYPLLSPMIASDSLRFHTDPLNLLHRTWRNPWEPSLHSGASVLELIDGAQEEYQALLPQIYQLFLTDKHSDAERQRMARILRKLGSRNYHSGLA
ncbi:MAG: zinc dependent phospholipase C family protein [Lachnospiraceae bacterium]|nr:zinc dependent phospholipase C family protein [Lachnospiraceae bacterium]MCI9150086.1 zinc dependent phospholipase C family protein [Lachnospiraceae bacterium]